MSLPGTENMGFFLLGRTEFQDIPTLCLSHSPLSHRRASEATVKIHREKENARSLGPFYGHFREGDHAVGLRGYPEIISNDKCQNKRPKKTRYLPNILKNITELGIRILDFLHVLLKLDALSSCETSLDLSRLSSKHPGE